MMLSRKDIKDRLADAEKFPYQYDPGEVEALETAQQLAEWLDCVEMPESDERHECQCSYCRYIRKMRAWVEDK